MRIVVTGGAGFIGSNFVRRLLGGHYIDDAGLEVRVLDKLTYAGTRANLAPVLDDPRLTFTRGDVCDGGFMAESLCAGDVVVHFAAESHVDRSIADSRDFVRTNVVGTHTVLQAAMEARVAKVVVVSTDEVYGSIASGSWDEDRSLEPNSPYSASKAGAELLARAYHRTHGLPVCVTRGSNTYGPYQFPEKLIPLFITNLLEGRTVPLYGDGRNVRDWIHVDDHCRALALVAAAGRPGGTYNIGGGNELTNLELTMELLAIMGADASRIEYVGDRLGHDRRYSLSTGKIERELGFRAAIPLREGLRDTVDWYRRNREWWEPLKQRQEVRL
ncbi:dTDP-glucose 4,6-dehydratase [Thermocatellispora tengchongensis]|uniref:dTDP-glucose 4,6-dehydratase n=1 Tax=Thermocatellispora tengchongensis TaxID=1073253 RepID=A0A840PFG8_9ACTN|nr:dTDP-glucose 4,6-dehydratase [Thermocatellispora tengchongensis]MBB5137516.1 dTDP-glucose 4,6-dehydratase [Thermocatellispora tengchongensis]